ncbi:FAD-linked oxidoreductase-like protein [Naematelia encephala]|uniref:Proline dehydrogenase n=1 Tax=Naematelia encephala TaxID=71784 RepID=A0A1Y2BLE1_9TREE|nr:FAD-linked oxidoreductase-like protein [Naematelia encephala]
MLKMLQLGIRATRRVIGVQARQQSTRTRTRPLPTTTPNHYHRRQRSIPITILTLTAVSGAIILSSTSQVHASVEDDEESSGSSPNSSLSDTPISTLIRSYFVWTLTSLPPIIDHSPKILHVLTHSSIPGLKTVTEFIVRNTFFAQFVPGETAAECVEMMEELRRRNVGSVLNYSAEAEVEEHGNETDKNGGIEKRKVMEEFELKRLEEVERALEEQGRFEDRLEKEGWERGSSAFALKVTGLIDPDILARASTALHRLRPLTKSNAPSSPFSSPPPSRAVPYPGKPIEADGRVVARKSPAEERVLLALKGEIPEMGVLDADEGLRPGDLEALSALWGKLRHIADVAKRNRVKLMIDAEHTWYQPSLDAYTLLLSMEYNRPSKKEPWSGPLIFGTYQSYLNRQPALLEAALQHAESNGYALGIKLVRGAYFVQERKKWADEHRPGPDPIWPDKPATDKSYNGSVSTILAAVSRQLSGRHPELALNVVFGTHNPESVDLILKGLQDNGLARRKGDGKLALRPDIKGKVFVAQLYGMKDDLSDKIVDSFEESRMPVSLKYVAYGRLSEVMPFLGRRAIENKSVMSGEGGAAAERRRVGSEIWRRLFG